MCCILLVVSYLHNDGNISFEMTFTITQPNTFKFGFKHRQLEYGMNDDTFESKYSDMDLAQIVDRLFTDSESLTAAVLTQITALTQQYIEALTRDIAENSGLDDTQQQELIDAVGSHNLNYEDDIRDIMNDLSFGDQLDIDQSINDNFRYFELPSMLVAGGMALCVLMMVVLTLFYFEYIPESCCCKCCTSFWCLFPGILCILITGAAWIALGFIYDAHVDIDWQSAEQTLHNGLTDAINEHLVNAVDQQMRDQGIEYDGWSRVLIETLTQIGNFQDDVVVGTSPWFQAIAGLLFLMFSCGFCCCRTKKEDDELAWDQEGGYENGATGGGDVEFTPHY